MARGSELGRTARRRRLELGVSQSRVAEAIGVPTTTVGRWERGEDVPTPTQMRALADVLRLGADTAEHWQSVAEAEVLSIEIVETERLAPPLTVVANGLDADPWSTPPERRIAPPLLDRDALIGRKDGGSHTNGDGNGHSSALAVVPVLSDQPDPSLERLLKRQARDDERRLRRELIAARRAERASEDAETRRRAAEKSAAARLAPLPPPPRSRPVPAPPGTANTGSVFPIPDTRKGSERVTYQGLGEVPAESDRITYTLRWVGTFVTMAVFAGLLWWAMASLGDGLGAVLDLFRGGESLGGSPAAGLVSWG